MDSLQEPEFIVAGEVLDTHLYVAGAAFKPIYVVPRFYIFL